MAGPLVPAQPGSALPVLVGREQPLARVVALCDGARAGHGRVVLVTGEAGIGKTRFAEAVAEAAARRGTRIAWGWCSHEDAPPYGPWSPALRTLDIQLPVLGSVPSSATAERQRRFVEVVEQLRDRAAQTPLVLVLEDLHCADVPSLRLLRVVADATPASALLVLGTCRDDPLESSPAVWRLLAGLPPVVERVVLAGLDPESTRQVAADAFGAALPAEIVDSLYERTGGNPFFAREVAHLIASRGGYRGTTVPTGVAELLQRRLARLSQDCHTVLDVAAVAGEDADVALLSAVTGHDDGIVLDLWEEAAQARLVKATDLAQPLAFVHALVREVCYATLGNSQRAGLHHAIAAYVEEHAPDLDRVAGRLSFHWFRAGRIEYRQRAAGWALRAGRAAMARYGFEQAIMSFRHALRTASDDRAAVLLELGTAQLFSGDVAGAHATYVEAADLARATGRAEVLAGAALGLGGGVAGFEVRFYDEAQVRMLREALAALPVADSALRAAVLARLSLALSAIDDPGDRSTLAQDAVAIARRVGDGPTEVAALAAYCDAIAGPDHIDERRTSAERMVALAEQAEDTVGILLARRIRLVADLERGDVARVDAGIVAYARAADQLRQPLYSWYVPVWRGMRALMSGDIAEAERRADEAEAIGHRAGSDNARLLALTLRSAARRASGRVPTLLTEIWPLTDEFAEQPVVLASIGAVLADAGELDAAARMAHRVLGHGLARLRRDSEWLPAMWCLGDVALALGDHDMADAVSQAVRPYHDVWAVDGIGGACFGVTAHQLGRLATLVGRYDDARTWLRQALERHQDAHATLLIEATRTAQADLARQVALGGLPPLPHEELEAVFRRQGRIWHVAWSGRQIPVPHSKGMNDLAALLAHPGRQLHVLDLMEMSGGSPAAAAGGDLGPTLDGPARAAYRRRLSELEQDLADAEADADRGRVERLSDERDFLVHELTAALGLGGRARRTGDPIERARKSVAQRIGTAIRAIGEVHPELARHLRLAVSTGRFCVYQPETRVVWKT